MNKTIENRIERINGTMAIEGLPLTNEDRQRIGKLLAGKLSYEKGKAEIIAQIKLRRAHNGRNL
ncbi:MAG: hypothetical protein AB9836_10405 [Aminipila sp.]